MTNIGCLSKGVFAGQRFVKLRGLSSTFSKRPVSQFSPTFPPPSTADLPLSSNAFPVARHSTGPIPTIGLPTVPGFVSIYEPPLSTERKVKCMPARRKTKLRISLGVEAREIPVRVESIDVSAAARRSGTSSILHDPGAAGNRDCTVRASPSFSATNSLFTIATPNASSHVPPRRSPCGSVALGTIVAVSIGVTTAGFAGVECGPLPLHPTIATVIKTPRAVGNNLHMRDASAQRLACNGLSLSSCFVTREMKHHAR